MDFKFTVVERNGSKRSGKIAARDSDHARSIIIERGFEVLSLEPLNETAGSAKASSAYLPEIPERRGYRSGFADRLATLSEDFRISNRMGVLAVVVLILTGLAVGFLYRSPHTPSTSRKAPNASTTPPLTLHFRGSLALMDDSGRLKISLPEVPFSKEWPVSDVKTENGEFELTLPLVLKRSPTYCLVEVWSSPPEPRKLCSRRVLLQGEPPTGDAGKLEPTDRSD